MLNLAQRLAIPPPVRSRPGTSGASMSAVGVTGKKGSRLTHANASIRNTGSGEKGLQGGGARVASRPPNVESMTTRGHLLFGPWGDVGAMSTDDLRRRWKLSGMQTSTGAGTVGAASGAELRALWLELQHMSRASMYMHDEIKYLGAPLQVSHGNRALTNTTSCSGDAKPCVRESGSGESCLRDASLDLPCAGGSPLGELSTRWRTLTSVPPGSKSASGRASETTSQSRRSLSTANVCGTELDAVEDQRLYAQTCVEKLSAFSNGARRIAARRPAYDDDAGSLVGDCLRKRWHEAFTQGESDVGALGRRELVARLNRARGYQGVGGMSSVGLRKHWSAVCSEDVDIVQDEPCHTVVEHGGTSVGGGGSEYVCEAAMSAPRGDAEDNPVVHSAATTTPASGGGCAVGAATTAVLYNRWCAAGDRTAPVG